MVIETIKAYHFDLKRGLWSRRYMDTMVDRLQAWGYNTIIMELEDKLRFHRHPAIGAPDAMTSAAMRDFVDSCREKAVDVIPMMQSLGHAECVVGKPEYAHLRESPEVHNQYDPLSPEAGKVIIELFDEIIEVMQPKMFFHLGGDETWSLGGSEKAQSTVAEIGIGGLYLHHMLPLFEHLHGRGLRPMIWGDILLSHPEIIPQVPDYVVVIDWDYWTTSMRPEQIIIWGGIENSRRNQWVDWQQYQQKIGDGPFRQYLEPHAVDKRTEQDGTFKGFYCTDALKAHGIKDILVAPANSCAGDLTGIPRSSLHVPNCFFGARKGACDGIGFLTTSWSVRHCHPEIKQLASFAAIQGITAPDRDCDFDSLGRAYTAANFGRELPGFAAAVRLSEPSFATGQAGPLVKARQSLLNGGDYFRQLIIDEAAGADQFLDYLKTAKKGYLEAKQQFTEMAPRALKNRSEFEYWIEGLELVCFYADFTISVLTADLPNQIPQMKSRLRSLRSNTHRLFAPTFTPEGLALELDVRYGFHELYLDRATT